VSEREDQIEVNGPVLDREDYTFYIDIARYEKLVKKWKRTIGERSHKDRSAVEVDLIVKSADDARRNNVGRAIICRCFRSNLASVTIRIGRKSEGGFDTEPAHAADNAAFDASPYRPKADKEHGRCLTAETICQTLFKAIFTSDGKLNPAQGLVLVTGRTGTMKSTVVRGLIYKYLASLIGRTQKRRPHLLTHEDPIERFLFDHQKVQDGWCPSIDYTPRDGRSGDTKDLRRTFQNALRQTPAAVYFGEIRAKEDWRHVVEFAGTGHLIFTTAHAGSLTETLQKLFSSVKADTPSRRGQIADSLHAVVHLSAINFEFRPADSTSPIDIQTVIPTLWRRTRTGVATLVADGLGAVVPNRPAKDAIHETSSLGKAWFADQMKRKVSSLDANDVGDDPKLAEQLLRECLRLDLEGI
jgi:hypothetical protein